MPAPPSISHLLPPSQSPSQSQSQRQRTHLFKPTTVPIPRNTSPYNHVHTPVVVLYYALRFRALVASPQQTLLQDLAPLVLAQCAFCVTCLPAAGTWGDGGSGGGGKAIISGSAAEKSSGSKGKLGAGSGTGSMRSRKGPVSSPMMMTSGGAKKDRGANEAGMWRSKIVPTILTTLLTLVLTPLPLTLLALILGAPLWPTSSLPTTILLCTHVSLLALQPLFYTHGVSGPAWRDALALWLPFDAAGVWAGSVGCFVGGWLGAVPIALDWDRDWQEWPCTVVVGVVAGWAVGRTICVELGWGVGKRIDLGESDLEGDDGGKIE